MSHPPQFWGHIIATQLPNALTNIYYLTDRFANFCSSEIHQALYYRHSFFRVDGWLLGIDEKYHDFYSLNSPKNYFKDQLKMKSNDKLQRLACGHDLKMQFMLIILKVISVFPPPLSLN